MYCYDSDDNDTVQQFSSTTTSTSTVNCSPRWIVHPHSRAIGAEPVTAATTQQLCLQVCINKANCVAVEWSNQGCWVHNEDPSRGQHNGITQLEIVRRCYSESGTITPASNRLQNYFVRSVTINLVTPRLSYNHVLYFNSHAVLKILA